MWLVVALLALGVLVGGGLFFRWALRGRRARREKQREFRARLAEIRQAVEEFEQATDFDHQIRLLADMVSYCSKGYRVFPDQVEIMNIARACEDERRKLAQHWAVAESLRLMKLTEESTTLRVKAGRADQVVESLKVVSRLLFPHDQITHAMRSVTQYQEVLEGALELPENQRAEAAASAQSLLDPYFQVIEELKKNNQELARVPWPREQLRRTLAQLEKV